MRRLANSILVHAFVLLFAVSTAYAQERSVFSRAELDQMLAPVALYPDALLSQILMASTYPLEVVQAARWSRANPGYRGQDAVNAVDPMDWDPSVKSLVAFPQVLAMMDERIDWTQRLGEAFLAQQAEVMDAVQALRHRAAVAGNLNSGEQLNVIERDGAYIIEPAQAHLVHVPYYDPTIVYGPWWWPAYPPVYWGPPAGYFVGPAYYPGLYWGSGIRISLGFFFGAFDWHHRHVRVHRYYAPAGSGIVTASRPIVWRHDDRHRRGVPYRYARPQRELTRERSWSSGTRRDFQQRSDARSPRVSDGARTAETGGRTEWRRDGGTRRTTRNASPAPTQSTQDSSGTGNLSGATPQRGTGGSTDTTTVGEPRRAQPERQTRRIQGRQHEQRPDVAQRGFRAPETRPAAQPPTARSASRPAPQARSGDQGFRGSRGVQQLNAAPRPAVSSPAPRAERAAPRASEGAPPANRGRGRQEPGRGRDGRS